MSPSFGVVICAHDERRWSKLCEAVGSVQEQTLRPTEVLVVVDHNEALLARVRRELAGVRAIANSDARGLFGARNTGARALTTTYVAFLDDDARASRRWLQHLAEPYENPDVAGVGGATHPLWNGGRPRWLPHEFEWAVGCAYRGMSSRQREVRNLWGGNMSFRRELVLEVGGFRIGSHGGGLYGDDTEFCIRLSQRWPDKRFVIIPEAKVLHHVDRSRLTVRRFLSRCYFEGGSKAVISRLVGVRDGLASERQYTWEVLPRGVGREMADLLANRDPHGLARAALIVAGLATTTAGYAVGHLLPARTARDRGWEKKSDRAPGGDRIRPIR